MINVLKKQELQVRSQNKEMNLEVVPEYLEVGKNDFLTRFIFQNEKLRNI